ncbi:flagellar biosynthetic protein FlhB [Sphaerotilus hippei]|uniref:Flagellar biosynthetic protein FlhB n=1 Tax=Sphaerotilus hippei TaxID=744406 RepID=A0A318H4Q3_9BURK|nr:flagellar biosynthesis protein FlhB [Sphaerotilus hippei]PXW96186.1 flagellar biosynthetic protein FlhB [Sphaerotilus hippei]
MADSAQDKQLDPTEHRLRKAREEGQVARSRDLSHFGVVAAGLAALATAAAPVAAWLTQLMADGLRFDASTVATPRLMLERLVTLMLPAIGFGLVICLITGVTAVASGVLSGGWIFTMKAVMPNFGKLNPLAGLGRIVSKQQLGDTLKACALALILGIVGASYLWAHVEDFVLAQSMALPLAIETTVARMASGLWLLVLVLAAAALIDVPLQRFMHRSRLKMSHQEVKEEFKQLEGNQEVKGRMKAKMREASRRRMLAAVPTADLVVMNPTHYAVALRYDEASMGAPRVVAKGADLLAMKIRDIAKESKVPVLQAPPLARALYAHGELDREIPFALFSAVAQVLAYVFQLRHALAGRSPWPADLVPLDIPPELDPHHPSAVPPTTEPA